MKYFLDQSGLASFAQKLTDKLRSIFATKSEIGTPLTAATAAAMTDTSKIYVYVGDEVGYTAGDWYYYDGSDWADGGIYNSTAFESDTTLSIPGAAADAKVTGDTVRSLTGIFSATYTNTTLYERGSISSANGTNNSTGTSNRFRTIGYLGKDVFRVEVRSGYKYVLFAYNGDTYVGNWTGSAWSHTSATWLTSATTLSEVGQAGYNYRLTVALSGDGSISASDYTAVIYTACTDPLLDQGGKAADAKAVGEALASEYDDAATYAVGDVVLYCGGIYVCRTAINTAEDFTPSHWAASTVGDILATLIRSGNVTIFATRQASVNDER